MDKEEPATVNVAVISDLHAYESAGSGPKPSHICVTQAEREPTKNPISGLLTLIETGALSADLLLCGGDLGDKAHPVSIKHAWGAVHELKTALKAKSVIATVGNHDVDSRYQHRDHDVKGFLQTLKPPFPFAEEKLNDRFWARNFAVISRPSYRVVSLNSSAFHGEGPDELKHGRISEFTLDSLRAALLERPAPPANILLCHHHPQQHMELELGEYDVMRSGQLLLDLLGSGDVGQWLVIHGHKHHPKICYASGGSMAPVVFSSGSLAASLYAELQTTARNQFYIVTLPLAHFETLGFVGSFRAWDWCVGKGWVPASEGSGLPHRGGFGCRETTTVLARRIAPRVASVPIAWTKIVEAFPELAFVLPSDQRLLVAALLRDHSIDTQCDATGSPVELQRRK